MRSLFLFLLLLNILYALWQLQSGGVAPDRELEAMPAQAAQLEPVSQAPGGASSSPSAEGERESSADAPGDAPAALCIRLGVFADRSEAEQLRQRLLALDVSASLIEDELVSSSDYWLVMPVAGGTAGALAKLSLLQEQGIDSFVITKGPLAGNISLGVFSREDYAAARQAQLQADGHDVEIKPVEKLRSQFSVEVPPSARRLVGQALLLRLREDFPDMQHQYQACSAVANMGNIP